MNQMIELAEIWQRVLGVGVVGPDDDFFASGGDSLLALQVVSEVLVGAGDSVNRLKLS